MFPNQWAMTNCLTLRLWPSARTSLYAIGNAGHVDHIASCHQSIAENNAACGIKDLHVMCHESINIHDDDVICRIGVNRKVRITFGNASSVREPVTFNKVSMPTHPSERFHTPQGSFFNIQTTETLCVLSPSMTIPPSIVQTYSEPAVGVYVDRWLVEFHSVAPSTL